MFNMLYASSSAGRQLTDVWPQMPPQQQPPAGRRERECEWDPLAPEGRPQEERDEVRRADRVVGLEDAVEAGAVHHDA